MFFPVFPPTALPCPALSFPALPCLVPLIVSMPYCVPPTALSCRLVDETGQPMGPYRVWLEYAWLPGLAMSRALGDRLAHS